VPPPAARVPRTTASILAVATVLAGLAGRALLPEPVAGPFGDALYAMLIVWLLVLVLPRTPRALASAAALAVCTAIEVSHLTDVPARALEQVPAARYVLGTTFGVADLAWYALGAFLAGGLLAVVAPRAAAVDEALRHVRAEPVRVAGRRVAAFLVPLAVAGTLVAAGVGIDRALTTEADELAARLAVGQGALDDSVDRVTDDAVRSALAQTLDDAETVLDATPVLERGPGDAAEAGARVERSVAAVQESRRAFATAAAIDAREPLAPVRSRAAEILVATDELADEGRGAGQTVRTALRDAVGAADDTLATAEPDRLDEMRLADLEAVAGDLTAHRDDVEQATVALMTAQDATVCPEPDQLWWPGAGRLTDDELAPIPWAPDHLVRADLVDGLVALDEAYRAEFGQHLTVNSAYRSYEDQVAVYDPADPNPLAAPPGCSNHGLGTAVDVSMGPGAFDGAPYAWMKANAERYGWTHPDWAEPDGRLPEPWHWESVETPLSY
jgi:zinc D-Ala-D-Ala carboxypeptidase